MWRSCTGVQTVIPGRTTASPISGVIVRWRVGDGVGQLNLRVARPAAGYPATTRTPELAAARR